MKLLAANNINIEGALEGTNFAQAGGYTIPNIITTGINLLLIAAGVGAFIFLLWGALDWILSGGAKEGAENARKKITGSIVGLSIVFSVYVLQSIVGIVFLGDGNAIFNFKIPTLEKIAVPPAPVLPRRRRRLGVSQSQVIPCPAGYTASPTASPPMERRSRATSPRPTPTTTSATWSAPRMPCRAQPSPRCISTASCTSFPRSPACART